MCNTSITLKFTNHVLSHESTSQLSLLSAIVHFCSARTGFVPIKLSTVCPCSLATETNVTELVHFNPLNAELNPICYLLALLAHHFLHVSRIRVKSLNLRLLMSYVYGAPILDVSRSHTTTHHSR